MDTPRFSSITLFLEKRDQSIMQLFVNRRKQVGCNHFSPIFVRKGFRNFIRYHIIDNNDRFRRFQKFQQIFM